MSYSKYYLAENAFQMSYLLCTKAYTILNDQSNLCVVLHAVWSHPFLLNTYLNLSQTLLKLMTHRQRDTPTPLAAHCHYCIPLLHNLVVVAA